MRRKAIVTIITALALLGVWVPSAEAKPKWAYGNGQSDLAVEGAPGNELAVCTTSITGFAGVGTSVDPAVTPPPLPPTTGFTVELYAGDQLSGSTHTPGSGQLTFENTDPGRDPLLPLQTTTTAPPAALDPPEEYADFQGEPIWEYADAPFTFTLPAYPAPGSIAPGSEVLIVKADNTAYYQTSALNCTTTTLTSTPNPADEGEAVTFTATVTQENGQPATGSVSLLIGDVTLASASLNSAGQAVFNESGWLTGDYEVTAFYLGQFPASSSSATITQTIGSTSDTTPPTFGPCKGGPFLLNSGNKSVSIAATDEPGGSGLNTSASSLTRSVSTRSVGTKTVTFTAEDNAGNTATKKCTYRVKYVFSGFFAPVDNGLVNLAEAGKTVPFKFSVPDAKGAPVTDLTSATPLAAVYTVRRLQAHRCRGVLHHR